MKESIAVALIALAFALGYLCGHANAPVQKYVWASGATLYNVETGHLCRGGPTQENDTLRQCGAEGAKKRNYGPACWSGLWPSDPTNPPWCGQPLPA